MENINMHEPKSVKCSRGAARYGSKQNSDQEYCPFCDKDTEHDDSGKCLLCGASQEKQSKAIQGKENAADIDYGGISEAEAKKLLIEKYGYSEQEAEQAIKTKKFKGKE